MVMIYSYKKQLKRRKKQKQVLTEINEKRLHFTVSKLVSAYIAINVGVGQSEEQTEQNRSSSLLYYKCIRSSPYTRLIPRKIVIYRNNSERIKLYFKAAVTIFKKCTHSLLKRVCSSVNGNSLLS